MLVDKRTDIIGVTFGICCKFPLKEKFAAFDEACCGMKTGEGTGRDNTGKAIPGIKEFGRAD